MRDHLSLQAVGESSPTATSDLLESIMLNSFGLNREVLATTLFLPVVDILSFVAYVVLMIIYWQKLNKMQKYLLQK
ncbi:MAG: hypothetical protein EWV53_04190 [Microcystis panniformis Mp_MB_F_20051200_S9]|uniref:Uncharacterized protein n=1 Tax=Microcystis panniformis Mp_MB_F_20051200_S9 TaxID=2486223 RepID=A0A552Q873_9CHRO|nr:MAG: hypothetical protein EWV87_18490 [Microcystis panniformis Mp_GB_SS_20050300_S99]TRV48570.1 MAG: hypothetical protein EWV43_10195 [Microcystis panniformis Mp_MB_F_20080800_S26D]TRV49057.1 MAG: hypothetical protein EWV42_13585 [Microcystis panniformis Mp_GB_SS_20050300_S99D]TRV58718.1 MAG: hypothetical protein EWV69_13160 [Microcystis panniformis Mp_MB_F_20080800_S26]TRV65417.1 MAG: hypothetical protein EWV53_04190 [Microcystis panniformis Mp_MB_F_20051200_S9]TRV69848.1 MAG: hypothetical